MQSSAKITWVCIIQSLGSLKGWGLKLSHYLVTLRWGNSSLSLSFSFSLPPSLSSPPPVLSSRAVSRQPDFLHVRALNINECSKRERAKQKLCRLLQHRITYNQNKYSFTLPHYISYNQVTKAAIFKGEKN